MSLINSSILAGLLLAAIPLVLHLVMRSRPKRIEFPALQLLRVRQASNARRMRLRQILLLMLRALLLAALVLALARPSLPAADYSLRWWEWLGLAAAVVAAIFVYRWMLHRQSGDAPRNSSAIQRTAICRVFGLLFGLLLAILLTGVPWAVRVRAELLSPGADGPGQVPVAAVFLVDNSYSMTYQRENRTRLELAASVVSEQLERFPGDSQAAVATIDQAEPILIQADLSGLSSRTNAITATAVPGTLNRRLKDAIDAQLEHREQLQKQLGTGGSADVFSREIYILSDQSQNAWQIPDESGLAELIAAHDWLQVYFVDLSVSSPLNASISELTLSDESVASGRDLVLNMTVNSTASTPAVTSVETTLIDESGRELPGGSPSAVTLNGESVKVTSTVRVPPDVSWLQGNLRLTTDDPLAADNSRFFSIRVLQTPRVLLISDLPEEILYLQNAMQPEELTRLGITFCDCQSATTAAAGELSFAEFDAVFMCGLQRPDDSLWTRLRNYLETGGRVVLVAGSDRIQPGFWSTPAARDVVPALPLTVVRYLTAPGFLRLDESQHVICRTLGQPKELRVELGAVSFDRCWAVELLEDSEVLLTLTGPGNRPLLLERQVGRGHSLMFTSAMDNLADRGNLWNNLVASWGFLAFTDELLNYLTSIDEAVTNFSAGSVVDFAVPPGDRFEQFLLQRPGLRQTRGSLEPESRSVLITDAFDPGHYLLRPFESRSSFRAPFSINIPDAESNLEKVDQTKLTEMLGPEQCTVIRDPSELASIVRISRVGVEVFPVLLGLLLLLFCAEHVMANYFYDTAEVGNSGPTGRRSGTVPSGGGA